MMLPKRTEYGISDRDSLDSVAYLLSNKKGQYDIYLHISINFGGLVKLENFDKLIHLYAIDCVKYINDEYILAFHKEEDYDSFMKGISENNFEINSYIKTNRIINIPKLFDIKPTRL